MPHSTLQAEAVPRAALAGASNSTKRSVAIAPRPANTAIEGLSKTLSPIAKQSRYHYCDPAGAS